ncbi:MAG: UDP-N-acetylmuramoyl-tripeptide--D-alanyl-D-alanine ligase [Desulfobulbaceae bacterium]|nr:MAG: UDP-N-acetylmuramoyl-tripeptide--D-alanyl-D-alanine ligase [Desulfobulbaceae bacterium]
MGPAGVHEENGVWRRTCRRAEFGYGFALAQSPVWTLAQVLLATGGRLWGQHSASVFRLVSSDSRTIEVGDLFIALKGEKFDGHAFVGEAIRQGAAGLILEKSPAESLPVSVPVVLVADTLRALGDLAHYRRNRMRHLQVLAITGSSGKTTVKEMIATILARRHRVLKTRGNLNNLIGLPLSLLSVNEQHEFAVLEMGMNRFGEIDRMAAIARPDIACITNVQAAHLAGVGDLAGVARAKGELFRGMEPWTTLVVNLDDKRIRKLTNNLPHRLITFGRARGAMIRATHLRGLGQDGMSFTLRMTDDSPRRVQIAALGEHNVQNALAAAAMARAAGISPADIIAGLLHYRPFAKRLRIQPFFAGLKLIDDSYNANPASMLAALETVHNLRRHRRVVAVLGDMLELGGHSPGAHRFIGAKVALLGFNYLLTVGEYAAETAAAARRAGMSAERIRICDDKEEVKDWLVAAVRKGDLVAEDLVLVKASRGMAMETIIDGLSNTSREQE